LTARAYNPYGITTDAEIRRNCTMVSTDTLVLIDTRQGFSYWPGRFGTGHNAEFDTYIVEMKKPLVVIVELKETWMGGVSQLSWSPGVSNNDA
jgi:hypothetical protein